MPIADTITDWAGLRAASVAIGNVRAVAMRASAHLPEDEQRRFVERVNKRALREGWLEKAELAVQTHREAVQTLSKPVQNGADTVANTLAERKDRTRLGQSRYLVRASEKLAGVADDELLDHAPTAKALADTAAKVWPEQTGIAVGVQINLGRGDVA